MIINAIKKQLQERRSELEGRLEKIKRDIRSPLDHDFAEQAVELENDEVMGELGHEAEAEIQAINQSLIRMDEGSYGECQDCGNKIPEPRLLAQPYSIRCVRCEELRERVLKEGR